MAISKKRLKLCLYGNVYGAYRSQNLLKLLVDDGYRVAWVSPEFYQERGLKKSLAAKVAHKLFQFYGLVDLFIKALLSDVLYVLPVNIRLVKTALRVARLCQTKLIVEIHVLLYDALVRDQKTVTADSAEARALKENDILALTQSDYFINPAEYEVDYWADLLGVTVDKHKFFASPLFSEPTTACKRDYERQGPLRICWWGTLIALHGVDTMIDAMKQLQEKSIPFTCHLFGIPPAGQGHLLEKYEALIREQGLGDQVFIRPDLRFSDGSLPNYLIENCDLALGIFGQSERARAAVPTKLIDALTLGLPTLTMATPALDEFFEVSTDLWTCEPTADQLAQTIMAIENGTLPPIDWPSTRAKVLKTFSLDRYKEVIDKILSQISTQF
ncbi:MAG: glycosyltransferase [Cyanobacteria bacterium P01_G01_bin.38]